MATKKAPAPKSNRSKRATAATPKKTTKKASPKKRAAKVKSAANASSKGKRKSTKTSSRTSKQESKTELELSASRVGEELVTMDRRRAETNTTQNESDHANFESKPKLERRKKVQRRRQIDPTTCERDYSLEEVDFMNALDEYKRKSGRMFPTCSEILEVIREMGYVKLSSSELVARTNSQAIGESSDNTDQGLLEQLDPSESVFEFEDRGLESEEKDLQWAN